MAIQAGEVLSEDVRQAIAEAMDEQSQSRIPQGGTVVVAGFASSILFLIGAVCWAT